MKGTEIDDPPTYVDRYGAKWWCNEDGKAHRDNDQPALIYQNGKIERGGGQPARVDANCDQGWYKNGKCHHDNDEPALVCTDGFKLWMQNDEWHPRMVV